MKYDVFISYSRKDAAFAERLCAEFDRLGIVYFIDRKGIKGGENFLGVLGEAIQESSLFVLLASKNAYASKFTLSEVAYAFNNKEVGCVLPYIIDGSELPEDLKLLFAHVNWRDAGSFPAADFAAEVKELLKGARPTKLMGNTGTGPRRAGSALSPALIATLSLMVVLAIGYFIYTGGEKRLARRDAASYRELLGSAKRCIHSADSLKSMSDAKGTLDAELVALLDARQSLDSASTIKTMYSGTDFESLFSSEDERLQGSVQGKLDSMYRFWRDLARDWYTRDGAAERAIAKDYAANALKVRPESRELDDILQ